MGNNTVEGRRWIIKISPSDKMKFCVNIIIHIFVALSEMMRGQGDSREIGDVLKYYCCGIINVHYHGTGRNILAKNRGRIIIKKTLRLLRDYCG